MSRRVQVLIVTLMFLPLIACLEGPRLSEEELQGQDLYINHCAECHEKAHPELHKQPPNLHGLFRATTLPSGIPISDAQVRKTIIEGRGTMPAFDRRLPQEDVDDMVKYLHTLK